MIQSLPKNIKKMGLNFEEEEKFNINVETETPRNGQMSVTTFPINSFGRGLAKFSCGKYFQGFLTGTILGLALK